MPKSADRVPAGRLVEIIVNKPPDHAGNLERVTQRKLYRPRCIGICKRGYFSEIGTGIGQIRKAPLYLVKSIEHIGPKADTVIFPWHYKSFRKRQIDRSQAINIKCIAA